MQIREERPAAGMLIESYGDGGFRVNDGCRDGTGAARHQGSVIIGPDKAVAWNVIDIADAGPEDFAGLIAVADEIDLLLIGTGDDIARLPGPLHAALAAHFGIEQMATGAAARTYNVLLAEGRRVAAALIAVA